MPTKAPTGPASGAAPTEAATATPTQLPTHTASPTSTSTPVPAGAPSRTLTPTATSTPSPQPKEELEAAQRHQYNGDYDKAIGIYLALLADAPTSQQAREARYGLAESYFLNRNYEDATAAWEDFVARYPDDPRLPQAALMSARAYHAIEDCSQAIPHYQGYLTSDTILADMVTGWLGDCLSAEGDIEGAINAYQQGLAATSDRAAQLDLRERVAAGYLTLEEHEAALAEYDAMLPLAHFDYQRANIEYLAGQALAALGQMEAAHTRYRRALDKYPKADSAYLSLLELVDTGIEVGDFQRGLVLYWAGENHPDAYFAATQAFDRYLATDPTEKADEALYRKAQAHRAIDQAGTALETLQRLIAGYPESSWQVPARMEKGAVQAWLGRSNQAVKTYQDLATQFPTHEMAPQALWQAAELHEKDGAYGDAAALYEDLQARFPTSKEAAEALWRAGLVYYRADDQEKAVTTWQLLIHTYPKSSYRAKSLYWLGKLEVTPPGEAEGDYWDQLVATTPNNYYAFRVNQIRAGESLTATRFITGTLEPISWDEDQARQTVLDWLKGWAQIPASANLQTLPASLADSRDQELGPALLAVGLRKEAIEAFDQARASVWDDPLALAQLAFFLREQGFHGLAARSALRLAALWPHGSIYTAPADLQRLAYPLAYTDLLSTEAQARNLDPLILAALIRQESLFEPSAKSYAGARGLGQVMPATGKGIARRLEIGGFTIDDLYLPATSVKFGAYYLAVQMKEFDDQLLVALAAYNGGPGNTRRWLEADGDDLDFFVEVIIFDQSRLYVQKVYQGYIIYERLYRSLDDVRQ
jgi:soluble lytic murein transglycosylase